MGEILSLQTPNHTYTQTILKWLLSSFSEVPSKLIKKPTSSLTAKKLSPTAKLPTVANGPKLVSTLKITPNSRFSKNGLTTLPEKHLPKRLNPKENLPTLSVAC